MLPYINLLLFVTVLSYIGRRFGSAAFRRLSITIVALTLIFFSGWRNYTVGTDTETYIWYFYTIDNLDDILEQQDKGYYLLMWLAQQLSDNYAILLLLVASIVVICYFSTILRVVKRYETSIFLFITLSIYTFSFNGIRQGIAAALCFLALPFLLDRKKWPYIALVVLAFNFHPTALINLPLYWLASPQINVRRLIIIALATLVTIVFLNVFVGLATEFLSDKYADYAQAGDGGGRTWVAFLVCQGLVLYYFKDLIPDSNVWYARLLNIYMIGLIPAIASTLSGVNPSGLLRLHLYFSSMAILLWPMVFYQIRSPALRLLLTVGFLGVTVIFFIMTTSSFSDLTPYQFNTRYFL